MSSTKKKKDLVIMLTLLWQGVVAIQTGPHAEYHLLSAVWSFLFNICAATKPMFLTWKTTLLSANGECAKL